MIKLRNIHCHKQMYSINRQNKTMNDSPAPKADSQNKTAGLPDEFPDKERLIALKGEN